MNQNLLSRVLEFLRRKMWNKRWQRAVTCLAAVAVFGVTYALVLPAITLTGPHPVLKADAIKAAPGEELEVEIQAKAGDEEEGTTFVLTALGDRAAVSDAYVFDEDGIALIKTKDDQEIELHRSAGRKDEGTLNYWFVLGPGEEAVFSLELTDQIDVDELVKVVSQGEYFTDGTKKDDAATNSNAAKAAAVVKSTASDASKKASASNATSADATDEDGLLQDGAVQNDLDEVEEEDASVTATLLLSAGSGKDLEEAVRDAEKNADKRGDAQIKFKWVGEIQEVFEKSWSGSGVKVTLQYEDDAEIPEDAVLVVNEVTETAEGYAGYVQEAETAMSEAAGTAHVASSVKLYDIQILAADGTEIEPVGTVNVTITNEEGFPATAGGEVNVVHFAEDGAKVMELAGEAEDGTAGEAAEPAEGTSAEPELVKTVKFTTDSFSLYAVVTLEQAGGKLVFDGGDYTVTVTYPKEAAIPVGTQLQIRELDYSSEEFLKHLCEAWEAVNKEALDSIADAQEASEADTREDGEPRKAIKTRSIADSRFFDITLMKDGKEYEPKCPVTVEVVYKEKGLSVENNAKPAVVHFAGDKTEVIEDLKSEKNKEEITSIEHSQSSFSLSGYVTLVETDDVLTLEKEAETFSLPVFKNTVAPLRTTQTLPPIEAYKTREDNGNGTYTINLNVKGNSVAVPQTRKANVVLMVDYSGSMWGTDGNDGVYLDYVLPEGGRYYSNVKYYYKNASGEYSQLTYNSNDYYHLYLNGEVYTGTIYRNYFRWEGEYRALQAMLSVLMDQNGQNGAPDDLVEVALGGFGHYAGKRVSLTNNKQPILTNLANSSNSGYDTSHGGYGKETNWEAAMLCTQAMINEIANDPDQAGEDIYVIFITDGGPNRYMKSGHTDYGNSGSTQNPPTPPAVNYKGDIRAVYPALDDARVARDLVAADPLKGKFYSVFSYGWNDTYKNYLRGLNNYAQHISDSLTVLDYDGFQDDKTFFDASDTDSLHDALQSIADVITSNVGYGEVVVHDGISADSTTTTVVSSNSIDLGSFRYDVTVDKSMDVSSKGYTVTVTTNPDDGSVDKVYFLIEGETEPIEGVKPEGKDYYSATLNGKEYKMALADVDIDGNVVWDLSPIEILKKGHTYNLSFIAWPNQETYDLLSDLNNNIQGTEEWNPTLAIPGPEGTSYEYKGFEHHPYIVRYTSYDSENNPVYTYDVLSNTEQYVTYDYVQQNDDGTVTPYDPTHTEPYRKPLDYPEPMSLGQTQVEVEKAWEDSLDTRELKEIIKNYEHAHPGEKYSVTLDVYQVSEAGTETLYKTFVFEPEESPAGSGNYTWPKQSMKMSPGTLLSESQAAAIKLNTNGYDYETVGGVKYYILEKGHIYRIKERNTDYHFEFSADDIRPVKVDGTLKFAVYKDDKLESFLEGDPLVFKGTNKLKGGLDIKKVIDIPSVDEILGAGGFTTQLFQIDVTMQDSASQAVSTDEGSNKGFGYRIIYGPYNDAPDEERELVGEEGFPYGRSKTRYPINDGAFSAEIYASDTIRVTNVPSGTFYSVAENGQPIFYTDTYEFSDPQKEIELNEGDLVTVTNTVIVKKLKVFKVSATNIQQPLSGAKFDLYGSDYLDAQGNVNPDAQVLKQDLVSDAEGYVEVGYLAAGPDKDPADPTKKPMVYYLVETAAPAGFYKLDEPIKIEITKSTFKYSQPNNSLSDSGIGISEIAGSPEGFQITVTNTQGIELPHTGGPGTLMYTLSGLFILIGSAVMYIFRRRQEERRAA